MGRPAGLSQPQDRRIHAHRAVDGFRATGHSTLHDRRLATVDLAGGQRRDAHMARNLRDVKLDRKRLHEAFAMRSEPAC